MALLTECWVFDALSLTIGLMTLVYFPLKYIYSYWDRKGFKTAPGYNILLGHMGDSIFQRENFCGLLENLYKTSNEPFVGIYMLFRPTLLIRDVELARNILIKDSANFVDRGVHINEEIDPLSANLFGMKGEKWKNMRSKLTPAFSSGKLKAMFSTIIDCGVSLESYLDKLADSGELIDVRETAARYITNIIASVAFGLDVDTIVDTNSDFRKYGRKIFEANPIMSVLFFVAPKLLTLFRVKTTDSGVESFMRSIVKQMLEYREKNGIVRKDLFQLLVQLRNTGKVQVDGDWKTNIRNDEPKFLTDDEITAQAFVFFGGGFETTSSTTTICLFEIVKNPAIQQRVHDEIDRVMKKYDGNVTYESISEMKYLSACIEESQRLNSVVAMLMRTCTQDYEIPGTNKIIEKGVEVYVPVYALHRDPKYYEEPLKFIPERFLEENVTTRNQTEKPFMPFGMGPRNCIGQRMAKLITRVALFIMLRKFRFEPTDKDKGREMQFDPKTFIPIPLDDVFFHVHKR